MDYTCQARNYNFPWVHMELYLNFYHTTLPKDMLVSIIISTKKRGGGILLKLLSSPEIHWQIPKFLWK